MLALAMLAERSGGWADRRIGLAPAQHVRDDDHEKHRLVRVVGWPCIYQGYMTYLFEVHRPTLQTLSDLGNCIRKFGKVREVAS